MEANKVTIDQIVTFAILMENDEGIMGKAPSYIRKKFNSCTCTANPNYLEAILNCSNKAKLQAWRHRWT